MVSRQHWSIAALLCLSGGCLPSDDAPVNADITHEVDGAQALIHATLWEAVPSSDDPIAATDLLPEDQCGTEATTIEFTDDGTYYDIDTTDCGWLTVTQPALDSLSPGDTLRIWAFRWANVVAEGAGRLTVAAGEPPEVLWEVHPELPNDTSELYYEDIQVTQAVPAGTDLYWHVSNHGQNVWSLIGLLRVDE